MTAGRLGLRAVTAETLGAMEGGTRVNTQRQDVNALGRRESQDIFSVALCVHKVVRQGRIWIVRLLRLFWTVESHSVH